MTAAALSRAFKVFIWEPAQFSLLAKAKVDGGWNDGGCAILAEAVMAWLVPHEKRYVVFGRDAVQHALVRVGDWYIDGDGLSRRSTILKRWRWTERVADAGLLPDPIAQLTAGAGFPWNRRASSELARRLKVAFPPQGVLRTIL